MGEAAEALGVGFTITWQGETYQFAPIDNLKVIAAYECYLEQEAFNFLARAKERAAPDAYRELADGLRRDIVSGVYSYGSTVWAESLGNRAHMRQMLLLMGQYHRRDLTVETVTAMMGDRATLDEILAKCKGLDPNPKTPAA